MDDITINAQKFLGIQVCAIKEKTTDEIEVFTNKKIIAGTTYGWRISPNVENPVQCADHEDRQHWVLDFSNVISAPRGRREIEMIDIDHELDKAVLVFACPACKKERWSKRFWAVGGGWGDNDVCWTCFCKEVNEAEKRIEVRDGRD